MPSPLFTIHKPELVGGRWATSVKFAVRGQPVELVIHASQALGDKLMGKLMTYGQGYKEKLDKVVAFGGVAKCCSSCASGAKSCGGEQFGDDLSSFSGVLDIVNRISSNPEVYQAIGNATPLDEAVRQFTAITASLADPLEAPRQNALLQQVFDLANSGDADSQSWLLSMMEVGGASQLFAAASQGDAASLASVQSIQLGAMQGDADSLHQYLTLEAVSQGAAPPMLVLHDADQEKTPVEASVEIGRALVSQRSMGSRARSTLQMLKAAIVRTMGKVHSGPTLVRAPYRALLSAPDSFGMLGY